MCLKGVWKVLEGLWKLYGRCLQHVWKVSGTYLEGVRAKFGRHLEGIWKVFGGEFLNFSDHSVSVIYHFLSNTTPNL